MLVEDQIKYAPSRKTLTKQKIFLNKAKKEKIKNVFHHKTPCMNLLQQLWGSKEDFQEETGTKGRSK